MFGKTLAAVLMTLCISLSVYAAQGALGPTKKPQSEEYTQAVKAVKAKDYNQAVLYLRQVVEDEPENVEAWNYLGYSHRQLRQFDDSLSAYTTALELDPKHRGAHEYLGELYLQTDQPAKAKQQLQIIDDLCFLTCKEYRKLKKAIKKYEAG